MSYTKRLQKQGLSNLKTVLVAFLLLVFVAGIFLRFMSSRSKADILWDAGGVLLDSGPADIYALVDDGYNGAFTVFGNSGLYITHTDYKGDEVFASAPVELSSNAVGFADSKPDTYGGAIVTWSDLGDPVAQKVASDGTKEWGSFYTLLSSISVSGNEGTGPKLIEYKNGGALVFWIAQNGIQAQRLSKNGDKLWGNDGVSFFFTNDSLAHLNVVSNGSNGAFIKWENLTEQKIYVQSINSDGNVVWNQNGEGKLVSETLPTRGPSLLEHDGSGNAFVVWDKAIEVWNEEFSKMDTVLYIYGQKLNSSGQLLWGEINSSGSMLMCPSEFAFSCGDYDDEPTCGSYYWDDNSNLFACEWDYIDNNLLSCGATYVSNGHGGCGNIRDNFGLVGGCDEYYTIVSNDDGFGNPVLGNCKDDSIYLEQCTASNEVDFCSNLGDEPTCNDSYQFENEFNGYYQCEWDEYSEECNPWGQQCGGTQDVYYCTNDWDNACNALACKVGDECSDDPNPPDPSDLDRLPLELYEVGVNFYKTQLFNIEKDRNGGLLVVYSTEHVDEQTTHGTGLFRINSVGDVIWGVGNSSIGTGGQGMDNYGCLSSDNHVITGWDTTSTTYSPLLGSIRSNKYNISNGASMWPGSNPTHAYAVTDSINYPQLQQSRNYSDYKPFQRTLKAMCEHDGGVILSWLDFRDGEDLPAVYVQRINENMNEAGHLIQNLNSSFEASVPDSGDNPAEDLQRYVQNIRISKKGSPSIRLADFQVNFASNRNFSEVSMGSSVSNKSAFFHNTNNGGRFADIPGVVGDSYTLYVPAGAFDASMSLFPGASSLPISPYAPGGIIFEDGQSQLVEFDFDGDLVSNLVTVNKVEIEGLWYWQVENVLGTGGISITGEFSLRDTLTRLEVGQYSDHRIEFGTVNGLANSSHRIEIEFDPREGLLDGNYHEWDLSEIGISDLEFLADGTPLTLGAVAGADVWGVDIDSVNDIITLNAPTSGSSYLDPSTPLMLRIGFEAGGTNQIKNPDTVADREIHIRIFANGQTETGEMEIPIIDDDTVNIHGYLDTFLHFDIDTVTTDTDCASGVDCQSYEGAGDVVSYVVSLGEMILHTVRKSGDTTLHADGGTGAVNYIWFDIETNATSGAVVTVDSLYGGLQGPGSFLIPSTDESTVNPLSGRNYGLNSISTSAGLTAEAKYDGVQGTNIGSVSQTTQTLFSSSGPVLLGRSQFEVLAYPDTTTPTGTYTDQLTFIATAGF